MKAHSKKPIDSWLFTDIIVGALNILLQMEKLRQNDNETTVTERSLRVSRLILDTTIDFDETLRTSSKHNGLLYMYCIAFYPFRACFSLYYHILLSNDPQEYSEDVERLEKIGTVTTAAAQMRFEWIPIAKAIQSLNKVARHIQQTQASSSKTQWADSWPIHQPPAIASNANHPETVSDALDMLPVEIPHPDFAQWLPDLGDVPVSTTENFQHAAAQPDFRPVAYMQAIEDQFAEKNWNYSWWDVNDPV